MSLFKQTPKLMAVVSTCCSLLFIASCTYIPKTVSSIFNVNKEDIKEIYYEQDCYKPVCKIELEEDSFTNCLNDIFAVKIQMKKGTYKEISCSWICLRTEEEVFRVCSNQGEGNHRMYYWRVVSGSFSKVYDKYFRNNPNNNCPIY